MSADASSFGLGVVLLQCKGDSGWKPVAYASRFLSETKRCYTQIEKEALAVTWSCEKLSDYILGSKFEIETDHKPFIPLLSNKHLNNLPPRVLRFRLRMAKYDYTISHVPGKLLYTADTLSRDPAPNHEPNSLQEEVETFVNSIKKLSLPATEQRLDTYRQSQQDPVCSQVREFCKTKWVNKKHVPQELMPYWKMKDNLLTICDNLLLYNSRIVVLKLMQKETLQKIHAGHLGIEKCKKRTSSSI